MIIALISGFFLGIIFFGGLWFTVKMTLRVSFASIWILTSSVIRTAIVLSGFYFVAQGNWQRLLLAVLGFIASRFLVLWLNKGFDQKQTRSPETSQP